MPTPIKDLRGVTDAIVEPLKARNIKDNEQFVTAAATPDQRKILAADCGCDATTILQLANRADLARVRGMSGVYSDLLEHAGVDTAKELATRRPENLHAKIGETNEAMNLSQRPPNAAQVQDRVEQAKALPSIPTYLAAAVDARPARAGNRCPGRYPRHLDPAGAP